MVLVPSLLHTGTPEKSCLLLSHLNETVTVNASLGSQKKNRSLYTDLVAEKDLFHCVSFTLPRISSSSEVAVFIVHIKGPTQDFRKRNTVLIKNDQSLIFVQTNKPIYKPGQTVKFCIMSLDENFHPLNELIPLVYLENPKRNRIRQWQKLKLESDLKQLAFSLSSEPILGSYKVVVQKESSGSIEHPVSVEEFVVPKFEVKVQVPKIIGINEEKLNISVCGIGSYVHLEPVAGTLPCGQTQIIKAYYIRNEQATGELKELIFSYLADLSFSPAQSLPASHAHLRVTASPQSLCALRAVDQSVLLMKPEAELSPSSQEEEQASCTYPYNTGNEVLSIPVANYDEEDIYSFLKPEGIEQEKTFNSMTCASGDILGSAMQNIQNLLQMPYGCGEQNMVLFAPNIYVLNNLNESQQLTPEIKSKAIGYLINCKLTAFVQKIFAQSQTYIFIDEAHITQALIWLSQNQKDNGCFRNTGSLLNNAIKGGVEDEMTLSAYITIALLEGALPVTKQQNSYGGFSSSQDTVVALHALSIYKAATFTRTRKTAQVTIQDSWTFSTGFQVVNNNLLLLQQVLLPEPPGEYAITVTGELYISR
ncbi:Pregnancy zone protein [Pteropus alecto]|uniref:Pregnancy zone protein n=1 Tax=Pteropus alecto TaxID=9402 RepID=L5KFX2_PTEAL|nr:Pregnancy zone protein [Pteropus alecto]